ncbi:carbonic anhydrase [Trichoderma novae-zelandiae]
METTPTIADLLERNKIVAESHEPSPYHNEPGYGKHPALIITCNDRRCIPERFFNIQPGEVVVHRNAGGNIRHALRDIIILDEVLGLKEIAIVHHTDCGTLRFKDEDIRQSLKAKIDAKYWPAIDAMHMGAITDVEQSVRDDLEWLGKTPFVRKDLIENTRGFVFNVKTGLRKSYLSSAWKRFC